MAKKVKIKLLELTSNKHLQLKNNEYKIK
jgi:hypothetical protein